ncbi:MAG TPA: hypothetical protein VIS94_04715 [Desulfomonilia bacterium]
MRRAGLERAACFISVFLSVLELILAGCAPLLPQEIVTAEDSIAAGKALKSTASLDIPIDHPDIEARKKIILIMNSIITEEYSTAETKAALMAIRNDPDVSRDLKVDAGYIISLVEIIGERNKDIDFLQNKNTKCLNDRAELEKTHKEDEKRLKETERILAQKEELIAILAEEKKELKFKLNKLEEIIEKSERKRGLRK